MATMKAIQWSSKEGKVSLIDAPKPSNPPAGHVVVKIAFCGVCGTDLHVMKKEFAAAKKVILGRFYSGYFRYHKH